MFHIQSNLKWNEETIIFGLFQKTSPFDGPIAELDQQLEGQITALVIDGDISAKKKEISKIHTLGKIGSKRVYFAGLGKEKEYDFDTARESFAKLFKTLQNAKIQSFSIVLDTFTGENVHFNEAAHALAEVLPLATYKIQDYKQKSNEPERNINQVTIITSADEAEIRSSLTVGNAFGEGTNAARTLVNMPGNILTATELAKYSVYVAQKYGFDYEVLEKEDMEKLGMGGLLAVNKGSEEPPKMIVLKYQGKEEWTDVIGLVGKGITFDTGGYSIKPKDGIVGMKSDMAAQRQF